MPMASVTLRPGVNTQRTLSLNEAGVSVSDMIRYKDGLIQKYGGWSKYYSLTLSSTIREIHAWQGLDGTDYLAVGTTGSTAGGALNVITAGSLTDITPQTYTSSFAPDFSVGASTNIVTVVDAGSSVSTYVTAYFNTQVTVGGIRLQGPYAIYTVGGSSTYTIIGQNNSSAAIVSSGILPLFDVVTDSAIVTVTMPSHGYTATPGLFEPFIAPTTIGGQTIQGAYQVRSVIDSSQFTIATRLQSTLTATSTMNAGLAQVVYYIAIGPPSGGGGYGLGGYGLGGYGMGSAVIGGTGDPIQADDWTMDNWGEALMACPKDGPIYVWAPDSALSTAQVITNAPFFNGGIFVSMPQQILVAWKSCQSTGVQDPLEVKWSDSANYNEWTISDQTEAGAFHIPTGSYIVGGLQAASFGVIWTDVDVWIMQYVGGDVIFNFTRVGSGCGLIGMHAAGTLNNHVYWCGTNNFYWLSDSGVQVLPCTVWDFIFQNLNTSYVSRIRCATNSTFSEIMWFFPSAASTGENDSYVKLNIVEQEWDYGTLTRTTWVDVSPLGNPISTDTVTIYQHEMTNDADGQAITASFESGYWSIADGNELAFVDWFLPDMKFGTYSGAQTAEVAITFKTVDYLGDTPRSYGPYSFTSTTEYLTPRLRGRFMSIAVQSNDLGSFWRIGRARYRFDKTGRR